MTAPGPFRDLADINYEHESKGDRTPSPAIPLPYDICFLLFLD